MPNRLLGSGGADPRQRSRPVVSLRIGGDDALEEDCVGHPGRSPTPEVRVDRCGQVRCLVGQPDEGLGRGPRQNLASEMDPLAVDPSDIERPDEAVVSRRWSEQASRTGASDDEAGPHHNRARSHVAEPLVARRREHACDPREAARGQQIHNRQRRSGCSVTEPNRGADVGDHPEARRELSDCSPGQGGLEDERVEEQGNEDSDGDRHDHHPQGWHRDRQHHQHRVQPDGAHEQIQRTGEDARCHASRLEIEDDSLGGHEKIARPRHSSGASRTHLCSLGHPIRVYGSWAMARESFTQDREPTWVELERLTSHAGSLGASDAVTMVDRYRRTSTHLAAVRTDGADPELGTRLTRLVGNAHVAIHGQQPRNRRQLRRFFVETFPAAVWWHRRFIVISALLFFVPALLIGAWMATSPDAVDASAPASVREAYLENDFEAYYSSDPAAQFATAVFINNIQVAILAFAVGILLCVPTAWVLVQNGAFLGLAGGLFTAAGRWQHFWGLITPHGLLEISAIVVAGAAGFGLGWAVIAPGDRPRAEALAESGKRSVVVVIGLVLAFLVAGMIEGFVTGTDLPTAVRVGIGIVAFVMFAAWVLAYGPAAERRGLSGVLGESHQAPPAFSSR